MALKITLVTAPGKVSVSKTAHIFNEQGGTLGRGESNVWVLPDPEKFLSSCHCQILYEANAYFLVDMSTNGTFLNSSPEPVDKGTKMLLREGNFFDMGDYRFSVSFVDDSASISPFNEPLGSDPMDDIFGTKAPAASDSFMGRSSSPLTDIPLSPDIENNDPLVALDRARRQPNADIFTDSGFAHGGDGYGQGGFDGRHFTNSGHVLDDHLGDSMDTSMGGSTGSSMDFSPSMDQHINWPNSSQENLIPDDWEDDFLAPSPPRQSPVRPPQAPAVDTAKPHPDFVREPQTNPIPMQPAQSVPASSVGNDPLDYFSPESEVVPPPPKAMPTPPPTRPVVQQPETPIPVPTPIVGNGAVDLSLVTAMGLDVSRLSNEQIRDINQMTGELMREIVDGMMQVLRSRTSIKNEFRMNVTTIQPVENNPLKFSVGVDEALENMFVKKSNAYKKPVEAFCEGFQEIGEHQVAMIAGIRHGFERMMERFNPDILEQNFNKQGKGSVIPGMQKAKYWSNYGEYYQGFVDNMESSFQHLFGSDFVHAYENQLRKLAVVRKKNK